jgi:hypothetical protein
VFHVPTSTFSSPARRSNDDLPSANGRSIRSLQAAVLESSNDLSAAVRQQPEVYECLDRSRTRVTHKKNRPPTVTTISGVNSA